MPRIPGPVEPRGVPGVISLPRPRNVQPVATIPAIRSPLVDFGSALTQSGLAVSQHLIQQERAALRTQLQLRAVQEFGTLENQVDAAGTSQQARAVWDAGFPDALTRLEQEAADSGVPEFMGELEVIGARSKISTLNAISRRSATEGVDNARALAAAYQQRLAGARTEADYLGIRAELHRGLSAVAQTNPLMTPGDADALLLQTVVGAAKARATAMVEGAVGNVGALAAARQSVLDERQHPDLPFDARMDLARLATQMEEQAIDRAWQQGRRAETLYQEGRVKKYEANMQGYLARLAADENITDQELFLAGANDDLTTSQISFLQSKRDDAIEDSPDIFAYMDARTQAEYGDTTPEELDTLLDGGMPWQVVKTLADTSVTSRRQGGIFQSAEVRAARETIIQVAVGAVGFGPGAVHQIFMDADPVKKRLAISLATAYDNAILFALQGTSPDAINPRQVAGRVLRDNGFVAPRPPPPADMAPRYAEVAARLDIKDIEERAIPELVAALNNGALDDEAKDEIARNLDLMRGYLDDLEQVELSNGIVQQLIESLPQEPARAQGFPRELP